MVNRLVIALESFNEEHASFLKTNINTFSFWQIALPVKSVSKVRHELFSIGEETATTNLRDLAADSGYTLGGSSKVKSKCIFIPAHSYMTTSD